MKITRCEFVSKENDKIVSAFGFLPSLEYLKEFLRKDNYFRIFMQFEGGKHGLQLIGELEDLEKMVRRALELEAAKTPVQVQSILKNSVPAEEQTESPRQATPVAAVPGLLDPRDSFFL